MAERRLDAAEGVRRSGLEDFVEHISVPIDCAPQLFRQLMRLDTSSRCQTSLVGRGLAPNQADMIAAAFKQHFLNLAQAQAKAMIKPDCADPHLLALVIWMALMYRCRNRLGSVAGRSGTDSGLRGDVSGIR